MSARCPATAAVRAGIDADTAFGAVTPPIVLSSNFSFAGFGQKRRYDYTRSGNPTRDQLGEALAELEGGAGGVVTATGMAAITLVLEALLQPGDRLVVTHDCYGGSWRLFDALARKGRFELALVDLADPQALAAALSRPTRLVWIETPSNPLLRITDLREVVLNAHAAGALALVDNTFLSPALQRPLDFGADLVLHSTTKYLNGHSDMVGGMLVTSRDDLAERLAFLQNAAGGVPGPMDCWLALRGIKTLPLRMRQHDANGRRIAEWLTHQRGIAKVYYPGLPSHPQHELACRQMSGFGGMISIELGDVGRARRFVEATRVFALAESLGGVESLIGHPASMTHASVPVAMRQEMGLTDSLVRLSCGIEDAADLIADLERALAASA